MADLDLPQIPGRDAEQRIVRRRRHLLPAREQPPYQVFEPRAVVGNLRVAVGKHPEAPLLAALIGELALKSPEFAALWADHRVTPCDAASPRTASQVQAAGW
ncbi:hypothetical protein [Streptomyces hundungensis]|uniref:MmyB family transcriptional regulator n=1 Tax=Streptomyces hundungensis TaxID=1077946 RepID=UPI003D17B2F4